MDRFQAIDNLFSSRFLIILLLISQNRVRKQVVNIPSFIVRLDSQKHIEFSLNSPFGGGRPGKFNFKESKVNSFVR